MADLQRLNDILYGGIDEHTGDFAQYVKVTTFEDGRPMSDALCDDVVYVKLPSGEYFKRVLSNNRINLRWYGLVPNDKSKALANALALHAVIRRYKYGHFVLPRSPLGNVYWFAPVPNTGVQFPGEDRGPDFAINFVNSLCAFEMELGVSATVTTGSGGIQAYRTTGNSNVQLINVSIDHENGANSVPEHCRLPDGTYDTNWGNYKLNGMNFYSLGTWHNLSVSGFPGHGVCVFGNTTIRLNGETLTATGAMATYTDANGTYRAFRPDDQAILPFPGLDDLTKRFFINGVTSSTIGQAGQLLVLKPTIDGPEGINQEPDGTPVTMSYYKQGNTLFADHITTSGFNNLDFNGGAGIFVTGDEANASNFQNISCRNNGAWGIIDSSLLGNYWPGRHTTQNGERFNDFTVEPHKLVMGGFTNRGNPNPRSVLVSGYTEGGNSGGDELTQCSVILGGVMAAGVTGGFGILDFGQMHNLFSQTDADEGTIRYGSKLTLQQPASPVNHFLQPVDNGWGVGDEQGVHWKASPGGLLNPVAGEISRLMPRRFLETKSMLVDGRFLRFTPSLSAILGSGETDWRSGDTYENSDHRPNTPSGWKCVAGGTTRTYAEGRTAKIEGNYITLSAATAVLKPGDFITLNGQRAQITTFDQPQVNGFLYFLIDRSLPNTTGATIAFAPPIFQPQGSGTGTLAQRPDLSGLAGPWAYYNTTTSSKQIWEGTQWVEESSLRFSVDEAKQSSVKAGTSFPVAESDPAYRGKAFTDLTNGVYTAYECRRLGSTTNWLWFKSDFLTS
ncbi:hypothetical protein [Hymenobacter glacieicola]|uniref:Uncharacterized protein n=1 Tax=Hymenobacter glacieicola TaxID=1562124 RepID=A0ABQ1X5A2_9BACT|nr:hypothetical protein [Hymenobacter glacieicola]GGG60643.1 hypothetical protein GCM10011378_40830 [Hymenobacter glacieicola]